MPRERMPENIASPRHAPKERRNPDDSHWAGKKSRTRVPARETELSISGFLPAKPLRLSATHMMSARSAETVPPQRAQ